MVKAKQSFMVPFSNHFHSLILLRPTLQAGKNWNPATSKNGSTQNELLKYDIIQITTTTTTTKFFFKGAFPALKEGLQGGR